MYNLLESGQVLSGRPGDVSSSSASDTSEDKYCSVDELPLVDGPTKGPEVKQSWKQSGPDRFEIQLVYYGVRTSRIVNDNMPVKTLFAMAIAVLNLEFGFGVEDDHDVDLIYSDTLMQRDGTLGSVPVLRGALIHIVFPMEDFFQDHGSTPDGGY